MSDTSALFTDQGGYRLQLETWLRPVAEQLVRMVWRGESTETDAIRALTLKAHYAARRAQQPSDPEFLATVVSGLYGEIDARHETEHQRYRDMLRPVVLSQLAAGASHAEVAEAAIGLARTRTLPPPRWLVVEAIEDAAREHRKAAAWWRRRDGAA